MEISCISYRVSKGLTVSYPGNKPLRSARSYATAQDMSVVAPSQHNGHQMLSCFAPSLHKRASQCPFVARLGSIAVTRTGNSLCKDNQRGVCMPVVAGYSKLCLIQRNSTAERVCTRKPWYKKSTKHVLNLFLWVKQMEIRRVWAQHIIYLFSEVREFPNTFNEYYTLFSKSLQCFFFSYSVPPN